jgi:hypothetical protein
MRLSQSRNRLEDDFDLIPDRISRLVNARSRKTVKLEKATGREERVEEARRLHCHSPIRDPRPMGLPGS